MVPKEYASQYWDWVEAELDAWFEEDPVEPEQSIVDREF